MKQRNDSIGSDSTTGRAELDASAHAPVRSPARSADSEGDAMVHRDLLAAVAHDLRSPLNAITLSVVSANEVCGKIEDAQAARRMERCLAIVEHSARHMHRMLEELLEGARVEATGECSQRTPIKVEELIDDALEMICPVAESKRIVLRKRVACSPVVACDRPRMLRVFSNLVGNAVKYTPIEGEVSVELDGSAEGASVRVIDSGPGVNEEQRGKLFKPYWTARRGGGGGGSVGLGLYIARGIVAAHGGRMWVETEPGRGSKFCFTIPSAGARETR